PIQQMSLDVHASQLVWLKKEIPGPMQMPYVVGLWGHAPAPPADKVWDPVGFVGELIAAGLDAAAEFVENALGQAYEAICNCCKAAVDTIKKHVDAALKWAKEKLGEIAKYVVDTFVNVVKEKILKDPRGFLHRLFTDPIGLGAEIAGDTLGKIAQDVTGIDVGKLIQDGLNAVKNWAVNTIGDAVKAGLEGLGLEGAAKVVGAIQTGVNVAQQTGSWAKGVAAGIRSLGGNEAQTAAYFTGTILGAVEAATGT
ncbi:MAG: hypothetical protein NZ651_07260, partial [Candidatus Bipolaricaulota bacterium]|nr:hypothetical protein [Candidatus Bipolaricaulota bacterium]MDW8127551.1 hypothetical protein [Candidatus Bipolaricaulota bacterium]